MPSQAEENEKLKVLLSRNKKEIDDFVLGFLPDRHQSTEISCLYEMMRDYPSRGGKGLRGTLCILWDEMFGGRRDYALITAAGLELFQNWILIHDDIEDSSDMRRGSPALHKKHGIEQAINVGDALHGKMWELLLQNKEIIGADRAIKILSEFSKMLNETTEGQHMELSWSTNNSWDIEEKDYFLMVTKKAAWYTCISPARLGVIIASAENGNASKDSPSREKDILEKLVVIGTDLGISFQIIDDVLNLTADESKYGKEILGDIYEGKRTLMLIHLLKSVNSLTKSRIIDSLSKKRCEKKPDEVEFVFQKMNESGSIDYAKELAHKHSRRALELFDSLCEEYGIEHSDPQITTRALLEYMTNRDY
ncbi:MAG: polyprenyl synthetase family protein [Nitrososphaerales archaeon]